MKTKLSLVLFFAITFVSAQAFTQNAEPYSGGSDGDAAGLSPGTLSIGVGLLDVGFGLGNQSSRGGIVGGKYFITDALNLGVDFGIRLERGELADDGGDWAILIAPNVQYYFKNNNMVTPFVFGQFGISARDTIGDVEPDLTLGMGVGAEYFLYDYFGLSAQMGVNLILAPSFGLGTFNTRLNANFYF